MINDIDNYLEYMSTINKMILFGTLKLEKGYNNGLFIILNRNKKCYELVEITNGYETKRLDLSFDYISKIKYFDKMGTTKKECLLYIKRNLKSKDFDYIKFIDLYHIFKLKNKIDIWYIYKNECYLVDTIHLNKWGV